MPFVPQETDIQKLFAQPHIAIPPYQRGYSWRKANVEALWTDITEYFADLTESQIERGKRRYFLGTIVVIAKTARDDLLLDGQQRLATIAIFLSVIRDALSRLTKSEAVLRAISDIDALLYSRAGRATRDFRLTLNREDKRYFQEVIESTAESLPLAKSNSHKLLKGTKELLNTRVLDLLRGKAAKQQLAELKRLTTILEFSLSFLTVKVDDEQEACDIFEHLNNRGVALGLADLLRNMLFRKFPPEAHDDLADQWDTLLSRFPDGSISDLVRYSWLSRHKVVSRGQIYNQINKTILKKDVRVYLQVFISDAVAYQHVTTPSLATSSAQGRALRTFEVLGVRQCMPLIIATMEAAPTALNRVLTAVNTFSFAFSTICNRNPNLLEKLYSKLAHFVRANRYESETIAAHVLAELRKHMPSREEFEQKFADFSTSKADLQKYILGELEMHLGNHVAFKVADPDLVWVEHIYPQKPKEKWPAHGEWLNRLGNLTLLVGSENRLLGNKLYLEKVEVYKKSEVYLTKTLPKKNLQWSPVDIERRQLTFAKAASNLWAL